MDADLSPADNRVEILIELDPSGTAALTGCSFVAFHGVPRIVVWRSPAGPVLGRNFEHIASASVLASPHLAPGGCVEVGWIEFGNWVPEPGETLEVYADHFLTPAVSVVPSL